MKIKRDAFLYLEPKGMVPQKDHAQCRGCMMWSGPKHKTCSAHAPSAGPIVGGGTCGGYSEGKPMPEHAGHEMRSWTKKESGYVVREVRCENCAYGNKARGQCELYLLLNAAMGEHFDLDPNIKPKGCCNANIPREARPNPLSALLGDAR